MVCLFVCDSLAFSNSLLQFELLWLLKLARLFKVRNRPIRLFVKLPPDFFFTDLLKLSDETDLDILNHCMEAMVDQFQTQLLPVAAQLAARLVTLSFFGARRRMVLIPFCGIVRFVHSAGEGDGCARRE